MSAEKKHDYHLVDPSPWPIYTAFACLVLAIGAIFYMHNGSTFSISEPINGEPVDPSNGSTLGFVCDSPEQIQEFHDVAIANGGRSIEDPPGPREGNMGLMYLCYFLDPNGHKICGIHRPA